MTYIEGTVLGIVYRNEDNGYTVLELACGENLVVCVGNLPCLQPGEYVRFHGAYTTHKNYGEQFKVASMETRPPVGEEGILLFLSGGLIKGVGEVLAARLIEHFHEDTLEVLENAPEEAAQVKGVSMNLALRIQKQLMELKGVRGVLMELEAMGMTLKQSMAVYDLYGPAAVEIIDKNPYRLIDDVHGIGFERADRIAAHIGLERFSKQRVYNGIRHVLKRQMEQGHTCLPRATLLSTAVELLDVPEEEVEEALQQLAADGAVSFNVYNGVQAVADAGAYRAESGSAQLLMLLARAKPRKSIGKRTVREVLGVDSGLTEEQEAAILQAVGASVCVITGGPGTGKTTILNQLIAILERNGLVTALAAPTGRAAKRMEKATQRTAKTIHRLLEYGMGGMEDEEFCFARDEDNPLEADAVIIDETSMVDIFLLRNLLRALAPGTRLILTGDADQLPSVGPGNVLRDIIASGCVPVAQLTEVFRQTGNIAANAHRVNRGLVPELYSAGDFLFLPASGPEETMALTQKAYVEALERGTPQDDIQVICPIKKGPIGVFQINKELRERLNPRLLEKGELEYGSQLFRTGDKVMQTVNNYGKDWRVLGRPAEKGQGTFNGDIGVVARVDTDARTLDVLFDEDRLASYEQNELDQLEHAYAVTVHKSQGNEFHTVILPLYYSGNNFLTRNLLYTAITRAKKLLVVIGAKRTLEYMVGNNRISRRYTALNYELEGFKTFMDNLGQRKAGLQQHYEQILGDMEL